MIKTQYRQKGGWLEEYRSSQTKWNRAKQHDPIGGPLLKDCIDWLPSPGSIPIVYIIILQVFQTWIYTNIFYSFSAFSYNV